MAERIKLADLYIDDNGVVRATKNSASAVRELGEETKRSSDVFTSRFFNMKNAATAFLGTFTLAGGIVAFKSFVTSIFQAQENFQAFATATEKTQRSMFRLVGDVVGMNQALADMATILDKIRAMSDDTRGEDGGTLGILWKAFWGTTTVGRIEAMLRAVAGYIGQSEPMGPPLPPGFDNRIPYNPTGDAASKAFSEQKQTILENAQSISEYNLAALEAGKINRELYESSIMAASGFQEEGEAIADLSDELETVVNPSTWQKFKTAFKDAINEIVPDLTLMGAAISSAQAAIEGMSSALVQGFKEGGLTFKKIISGILEAVGQMLVYLGSAAVIKGIFTYNAAEVGAGLAAIAIGGAAISLAAKWGSSSDPAPAGFGGEGFGASPALAGGGNTYNIGVTVEGSSNPEATGRRVALAIKRALADGAAGGSL